MDMQIELKYIKVSFFKREMLYFINLYKTVLVISCYWYNCKWDQ